MSEHKMKGVFQIIENERLERPIWRRIGTAFVNADQSLNIYIDALPLGGKMQVRELIDKSEKGDKADPDREAA